MSFLEEEFECEPFCYEDVVVFVGLDPSRQMKDIGGGETFDIYRLIRLASPLYGAQSGK